MMLLKISSGITYNNIVFVKELRMTDDDLFIMAEWSYIHEHIEIFTESWKQQCKNDKEYVDELIYIITHEVLHSEIEYAIAGEEYGHKGKNNEYCYNDHYPFLNGLDPDYIKRMR